MKKASKPIQPYPPEFRAEAIRLVRTSGKPRSAIARDLGLTSETLRLWVKQADLDAGTRQDGLTTEERDELRRLRKENRILREEREILVKAAAHLPLGRPPRCRDPVRVRRAGEGRLCGHDAVPGARCLPERVLGVAAPRAVSSRARRRPTECADPADSSGE
jgi:transposase